MNDKLEIIKQTRKIAADSLRITLQKLLSTSKPISEVKFRDTWLLELREHKEIFPDGWYNPPPHGISILFSTENDPERVNTKSLRWDKYWPNKSTFLNKEKGIVLAYASMVNRNTGIIGDFGLTLYFGKNNKIKDHFKRTLNSQIQIFKFSEIGKSFYEIYNFADDIFQKMNLSNNLWVNVTDPSGKNIGHIVPGISDRWTEKEKTVLENGDSNWQNVIDMLRKKRIFVSPAVEFTIQPGCAFTIEHRLKSKENLPVVYFHTVAAFNENGEKELLTGFDEIFKLVGMGYMLN